MTTSYQALIFDLDGTLIDSAPDVCASVNRVLEADGRRPLITAEVTDMIGWGGRALLEKALAVTGDPGTPDDIDRALENFLTTYAEHPADHTTLFPGVIDALEHFKAAGVKMAICTNKPKATTPPVITAMGLDGYFDVILSGDAVPHKKPDGRHVLLCAEQLGVTPEASVMVGDSENDIYAAIDAGIRSVCVTFGYAHVPLADIGADVLIDHFDDLAGALDDLFKTGAS
ncbi:MAG: phosphoglycolate phosphatase [Proteobacteria bacterium]|nr:phosphoglycolate phosphatase [Pseudomonadota bacterium]